MKKIAIYEPALCCSTGVCGPSVDQNLIRITGVMQQIKNVGGKQMIRYNLSANPNAFVRNPDVTQLIQEQGTDCLPITVIDDERIVKIGDYPTNEEITEWLDVRIEATAASAN